MTAFPSAPLPGRLSRRTLIRLSILAGVALETAAHSNAVQAFDAAIPAAATPAATTIVFPRDEGLHADATTEWWYYTGHLDGADGKLYGFEQVFFRAKRGALSGWAAHAAVTDSAVDRFSYDQRVNIGDQGVLGHGGGIDFSLQDWSMQGAGGTDAIRAAVPGFAFRLDLASQKPPVLHGHDGLTSNGLGAFSSYYSLTRYDIHGEVTVDGHAVPCGGSGWMDHQWGTFSRFSDGGWDWFALQLDDHSELMLYVIRDAAGVARLAIATLVDPDGRSHDIAEQVITVNFTSTWTSAESGATYPGSWRIALPDESMTLDVTPVMANQELDTRQSTGVTYWEGQALVSGLRGTQTVRGRGYVELTGYAKARDGRVP